MSSKMNFSEILTSCGGARGGAVAWSPDGRLVAWPSSPTRLQVRDSASLQVLVTFTCVDAVQEVLWAPDSQHLLSASYKRGMVEVWAVGDPGWRCRVDGGSGGIIAALWSPDSRHILTTADFYVQLTVWSLVSRDTCCVRRPKAVVGGAVFSPSGSYLVVAERRDCRDYLALFETQDWTLVKSFQVCTRDLVGVSWGGHTPSHPRPQTNTGSILAVWDSPLQYKVALYSLSGYCLGCYSAYEWALGVTGCLWSPSGQFLAICSCDDKVRLLSYPPAGSRLSFSSPPPSPPPPPLPVSFTRRPVQKLLAMLQPSPQLGACPLSLLCLTQKRQAVRYLLPQYPLIKTLPVPPKNPARPPACGIQQ
ncbi:WD repeat-containing protein WRAP73-like isoform X2 [Scylla paramamosain]|uniref:WD repeat-containing protein WRAP73-like isoform X2 n=1 Tax=Scylla paramamosain TaxID=85552 RepID=UPI003083DE77